MKRRRSAGHCFLTRSIRPPRLVMKISRRIHVLNYGRTLTEGDAATVRADPAVIAAYLGRASAEAKAGAEAERAHG